MDACAGQSLFSVVALSEGTSQLSTQNTVAPSTTGSGVLVNVSGVGTHAASIQTTDVDVCYPSIVPPPVVLQENVLPLVRALLQGVNACLLVCGSTEGGAKRWFSTSDGGGVGGGTLGFVSTTLFQCLMEAEALARNSGGGVGGTYHAQVQLSAVAIGDSGPVVLDLLVHPTQAASPGGNRLEVHITDAEGPTVVGATCLGPITSSSSLFELLTRAHAAYSALCPPLPVRDMESFYEPNKAAVSAFFRITLRQVMSPAIAALLAGGGGGHRVGAGGGPGGRQRGGHQ